MDDWMNCVLCGFSRESLLCLPCCEAYFCDMCIANTARCPRCYKVFDISKCTVFKPMTTMLKDVLKKCRYDGCDYMSTSILIAQHEARCKHSSIYDEAKNDLVGVLLDKSCTPAGQALQRRINIFEHFKSYSNVAQVLEKIKGENMVKDTVQVEEDDAADSSEYFIHFLVDADTLPGLSIKYSCSIQDIKIANDLGSDEIFGHTELKIPRKVKELPKTDEKQEDTLARMLENKLLHMFRRQTNCKSQKEAVYYLESHTMCLEDAVKAFNEDASWEKENGPLTLDDEESTPVPRKEHRVCCTLGF